MPEILLLNQEGRVGTILVAVAGALSTMAVSVLLLHMAVVAIVTPLKHMASQERLPRERVFLTTHLGYYLACFLISGLFGGVAALFEISWAQSGVILDDGRCSTQGIFLQLGEIGTATFSVIIAFHTMNNLVLRKKLPTSAVIFVIVLGWAFTLSLAIIGPSTNTNFYDIEGLWCWISISNPGFQIFMNIVPLLLSIILMLSLYGATYFKLRLDASDDDAAISLSTSISMSSDDYRRFLKPIARKLFFYPLVYSTLILPMTIVRLTLLFGVIPPNFAIILAAICDALIGFANTVVYVTTRNVGPSISWEGVRSGAKELITELPKHMLRESTVERFSEKVGSIYAISEPRLVATTNSAEVTVSRTASPAPPPRNVRVVTKDGIMPTFRGTNAMAPTPEYSRPSEPEVEPSYDHKTGAMDSVNRWRQRQAEFGASSPPNSDLQLPVSPQMTPLSHLRSSRSISSLRSYERGPTPSISRRVTPSNDGASVMNYQPSIGGPLPDARRSRVPTPVSFRSSEWDVHSQTSLISHIRKLSDSASSASSVSGVTAASSSNPRIEPGVPGGANLAFSLYPDAPSQRALGPRGEMPPEMLEASFSPTTAGYGTPKTGISTSKRI